MAVGPSATLPPANRNAALSGSCASWPCNGNIRRQQCRQGAQTLLAVRKSVSVHEVKPQGSWGKTITLRRSSGIETATSRRQSAAPSLFSDAGTFPGVAAVYGVVASFSLVTKLLRSPAGDPDVTKPAGDGALSRRWRLATWERFLGNHGGNGGEPLGTPKAAPTRRDLHNWRPDP